MAANLKCKWGDHSLRHVCPTIQHMTNGRKEPCDRAGPPPAVDHAALRFRMGYSEPAED